MGLFDGAGDGTASSTADVARLLDAPVLLVVDASAMSASVAAVVHGFATLRPDVPVAGVILNQVGSPGHEALLREALAPLGIPVLGALPRDDAFRWRDRHLGLVPVAEQPDQVGRSPPTTGRPWSGAHVDLDAVVALARSAPARSDRSRCRCRRPGRPSGWPWPRVRPSPSPTPTPWTPWRPPERKSCPFDPLTASRLPPAVDGLVVGGGFPEVHAAALAANRPVARPTCAARSSAGLPTWAECGGLLLLAESLDGHPMAGVVAGHGRHDRPPDPRLPPGGHHHGRRRIGPAGTRLGATSSTTRPSIPGW